MYSLQLHVSSNVIVWLLIIIHVIISVLNKTQNKPKISKHTIKIVIMMFYF